MRFSVHVDRGQDEGQNFGSLFEVPTADGTVVIGAGFQGVYNTCHRADHHVVQLFVRPTNGIRNLSAEPLPRPTEIAGTYLFDFDGTTYSSSEDVRYWDESTGRWVPDASPARERMRLGSRRLVFGEKGPEIDGRPILSDPNRGDYHRFYYAHGHIFFYHTHWADQNGYRLHTTDDEGFSKLYACPWTPDEACVDLDRAAIVTLAVVGETPFSYGQLRDEVLTCSNIGGVYVFDGTSWRTIVEPEIDTSYQVYSMINFYDRLLLAQYPTGLLFEYAGDHVTRIEGWPPRMEGVSASDREAQTTAIHGGDLFVGVWPWAELWRYNPDSDRWHFARRMLSHPPPTKQTTHPYEEESAAAGYVPNQWGQRVTSLVPHGDELLVSTSAKSPIPWEPKAGFVGNGRWREYGTVTRLTMSGSLSIPVRWTSGPTHIECLADNESLSILQDGEVLASTPFGGGLLDAGVREEAITWGRGIFGDFSGVSLDGDME